jgi:hypothetical protein
LVWLLDNELRVGEKAVIPRPFWSVYFEVLDYRRERQALRTALFVCPLGDRVTGIVKMKTGYERPDN